MGRRLQLLVPEALHRRIRKAARRNRLSAGEWLRQVIERALQLQDDYHGDPIEQLASLDAPTGDIEQVMVEISAGRS